ncbi:MAG: spore cortex biosynthesis protein YabQ [Clostridia bacterium]|nr:spore cortex biosynthesis protein YabQ [Clostridia bacterium]
MAGNQTYLFIVFTIVGIIIGILFDIFRILRKSFKTKDIVTYIEDILFWILTGIIILFSMYKFSNGELRFFMIIGIIMGTLMYMITFSRYVIKISVFIIKIIKTIIVYPVKVVEKILKKIIIRPIFIICINFKKNFINFVKKNKKNRGIFVKKEKYNNI